MARVLVLYSLMLLSITEAAGATQKSDIQEWPFPAVSELPFASVYFGGAVQSGPGARDLGGFGSFEYLARELEWRDFPVISTRKSINTRHHKPPLRGGRGASRPARPWCHPAAVVVLRTGIVERVRVRDSVVSGY